MAKKDQPESDLDQGIEIEIELSYVCWRFLKN